MKRKDGLSTGAWLEQRKSEGRCLSCGAKLTYRFDTDTRTGFLQDFCVTCRQRNAAPSPSARARKREKRQRGIENLDKILGKL